MTAPYNNAFGEWLKKIFEEHHITSSRQARPRTGIAHTTLEDILKGRQPNVVTTLKIAKGFNLNVEEALRKAGHDEVAALWKGRDNLETRSEIREQRVSYLIPDDMSEEEREVLLFYRGRTSITGSRELRKRCFDFHFRWFPLSP